MPEGPEVKIITDRLKEEITDKYIISISISEKSKYSSLRYNPSKSQWFPGEIPGSNRFLNFLPLKILKVFCKGKHIFFHLSNNTYIESTLGTEGKWTWTRGNNSNITLSLGNILKTNNLNINIITHNLFYDDSLQYGNLYWWNEDEFHKKITSIGPDLLSENILEEEYLKIIQSPKLKNKQIVEFLMSQQYFSGIGNYLKSEILYHARIRPNRLLSELSKNECLLLLNISIKTIKESYESNGLTIKSFWDPHGKKGVFKKLVYDEKFDPYGNEVVTVKLKDLRTTHWVPALQK